MSDSGRVMAGVFAAAALSLWGAAQFFGFETAYQQQNRDPFQIAAQTVRFEGLRAAVPESAVLGYLTDLEPGSAGDTAAFLASQYILAPRLLKRDTNEAKVLGNFSRPADYGAAGRTHGLSVERDFGSGVILFRREIPR